MTDPEIKPCPFCGSDDIHYDENLNGFECKDCLGAGPWAGDERKAAELWNNRFDCFGAEHDHSWGDDGMFLHESTAAKASGHTESYRMEPIRVERARALGPVWIVEQLIKPNLIYEGKVVVDEEVSFHEFPNQEESESAAHQMREAAAQETAHDSDT